MSAINPVPSSGTSSDKRSYEPSMEEILASIRRIIADDQGLPTRGGPIGNPASTVEASHELLRMPAPQRPAGPVSADLSPAPDIVEAPEPSETAVSRPSATADEPSAAEHGAGHAAAAHGVAAYGSIAAPQYPSPDGRIGDGNVTPVAREPSAAVPAAAAPPAPAPPAASHWDDPRSSLRAAPPPAPFEQEDEALDQPIEPKLAADPTPLFSASTDAAVSSAFSMLAASRLADNSEELMTIAKEMIRPMLRAWLDDNLPSMVERMVRAEIERVARGGR